MSLILSFCRLGARSWMQGAAVVHRRGDLRCDWPSESAGPKGVKVLEASLTPFCKNILVAKADNSDQWIQ